jgi:hypothetical protein
MKSLDTSFGSCEPPEPYPLPCFNLITLITYLFSLLPFTCLACLCASLCLCITLALTPYPTRCVGLSTYVIKPFSISLYCRTNHFLLFFLFFHQSFFHFSPPPPPHVLSHTFHFLPYSFHLPDFLQPACFSACFAFVCVASAFADSL